ncbi:MAG: alpha/beta fold hydrolase [Azospirillum sp.]|nr:alpha/beta fold hydrolase [Azospirillum sp.]
MRSKRFTFPGSQGFLLSARLDKPDTTPRAYALFAHCFTCTKDIFAASRIAQVLTEHGIAVLRFDFTGLGSSEGEFANTNFSSNVADLVRAADHLRQAGAAPAILIGHSLGGAAVLAAAGSISEVKAVATIGAPFDVGHVTASFSDRIPEIEAKGEAEVSLVGRPFVIRRQFLEDVAVQKLEQHIATLKRSLLILHAPLDRQVGIENAGAIFQAAKHPKSFVSLDRADHLLSRRQDAEYAAGVLAAWAANVIETPAAPMAPVAAVEGAVVVEDTGNGQFQQAVAIGPHRLLADEPVAVGGTDSGPGPYDLLLAALGACTAMTIRLNAAGKGWPLVKTRVILRHAKIHAADCRSCETTVGKIDRITREITFYGELDDDQRRRLLEIADKCPVHRTLTSEIEIVTTAA